MPADTSKQPTVMERLSMAREVVRMNFDEALLAHADWKLKLHLFIQGDGQLDPNVGCRDDQCKLGKWIYSEGMKYASDPDYETLRQRHAMFHRHTADVVRLVGRGDTLAARAMLGANSDYEAISAQVSSAISQMKRRVEEKTGLIMKHVAVGILVIDPTMLVQSGYSQHCHELLGAQRVGGRHICELLRLGQGVFELVEGALQQAFEDVLPPEVSLGMLPERVPVGSKTVSLRASALRSGDQEVDYIIFTLEDATRLVELEREQAESSAMLRALRNRHAFALFARDARARLAELLNATHEETAVRRDVHTLKGNAGLFELHDLVKCAGEVEDRSQIEQADLQRLERCLAETLGHFEHALGFNLVDEEKAVVACSEATLQKFETDFASASDELARAQLFHALVKRLRMRPIRTILGPIEERVALLAERLEKKVDCEVTGDALLVSEHKVAPLLHALSHAIRNAVDHGIEPADERRARAKPERGTISLHFETASEHGLKLCLSDDGRGIDIPAVVTRAIAKGLLSSDEATRRCQHELLELVFADGISTVSVVSDVSGRGVGMSALRVAVTGLGGSLNLFTEPGRGTRIEITIPDAAFPP